jgi:O-antigen/teichoic acid export membrane protein
VLSASPDASSLEQVVGVTMIDELRRIVDDLLACGNAGTIRRGFALCTPGYARRCGVEAGLADDALAATSRTVSRRGSEDQLAVEAIRDVEIRPDGRVAAVIVYAPPRPGGSPPPAERFTFVYGAERHWLIDDIAPESDGGSPRQPRARSADGSPTAEEAEKAPMDPKRVPQDEIGPKPATDRAALPMLANSLALIIGKLATMGLGFLAWLLAARLFSQGEVGLASGAVSAMMLCVQLALFGAGAAVITLFPQHRRHPADLVDTATTLVTIASFAAAGAFLLLASGAFRELSVVASDPAYAVVFIVMCVFGTLGVLFDQLSTTLRRGDQALVRGVVSGVVTLGMLVVLHDVIGATTALAILGAWAIGNVAPVAIGSFQLRRSLSPYHYRPRIRPHLARQLTLVGLPNWVLTLTERAPGAVLPIIVTEVLSPEANAAWYAAWMMAWVVYVVPIQVGLNLFAEAAHRPQELGRTVRHGIATSLAVGVVVAAGSAVVGPVLLGLLGGGYADEGTTPLRILVIAVVPFTFVQAYFSVCRAQQHLREAILTGAISGLVGVGMAAIAATTSGLTGMAESWLAVQIVTGVWALFRLRMLVWTPRAKAQEADRIAGQTGRRASTSW